MKRISYLVFFAGVSLALASCGDNKESEPQEPSSDKVLVLRSISVEEDAIISPFDEILVDYNNLIGINKESSATLNGAKVEAYVNPSNGMQLVIPVNCDWNQDYVVIVPEGMVGLKEDMKSTHKGFTLTFHTTVGTNPSSIDQNLTNAKATPEAKALYAELLSNYGKVMYSGAMGGVAWETGYTDYIASVNDGAGYPKIVGFDYIHLAYSPANWINYGDITPVQNVWKAGSIPTITWHWNVPDVSSDGTILSPDLLTFNGSFSPIAAMTPGTPQNDIVEADIKKMAGYMKLLQDANIPILFRPFHEAAGDYTWGPWFWWGKDGVEATKQLWNYLRTKLENEYGLNNLIWIWTVQTSSEGKPADIEVIRNAYPGDDVVDMVGVDLYPDKPMTDQTPQFAIVNSMVEGKKMVTLSEVGNLIDPAIAFENHSLWSYFMNWYDFSENNVFGFKEWNTQPVTYNGKKYDNPWAAVANSPYVVNR